MGANHACTPPSLLARSLHSQGLCTEYLSSPFEKCVFGYHCCSKSLPSFPHSPTLWQDQSLSQSEPVLAHLLSQLHVSLGSPKFSGNVLADDYHPSLSTPWLCVTCCLSTPASSYFMFPGLSWCEKSKTLSRRDLDT